MGAGHERRGRGGSASVRRYRSPGQQYCPDEQSNRTGTGNCRPRNGHAPTLTRDIDGFLDLKRQEVWQRGEYKGIELNGRTAVIIGFGGIGTQIAFRAGPYGMTVIGVDPEDMPFMPVVKEVVKPDRLQDVLPQADVVLSPLRILPKATRCWGRRNLR